MKSLMDGIVNALKRINQEKSQLNDVNKGYSLSSGDLDDYCNPESYNSR